ncbi:MAG: hypothetical protein NT105_23770 [Verrucomicrobia bacterium]|nr:hypothetical protein [Verrucomicrobiota bacterium]
MIIPADIMSDDFRAVFRHGSGRPVPSPSAPLENGQKAHLCILAREAFEEVYGRPAASQGELDDWRHTQQMFACGYTSLRGATQREYKLIEGRFLMLKGNAAAARRAEERVATEPIRLAMFKLRESLRERGLHESYAAAICRRQFKCSLAEATERQVWCLVYTVRNRRKAVSSQPSAFSPQPAALTADIPF